MKATNKIPPDQNDRTPWPHNNTNTAVPAIRVILSRRLGFSGPVISDNTQLAPKINNTLAMLEPMMLPSAKPGDPDRDASNVTTSSGAEVPMATTVMPITNGDTFKIFARLTTPRIKISAENSKTAKPPINCKYIILS